MVFKYFKFLTVRVFKMRFNKRVLVFAISAAILSGCSSTDEKKGSLLEGSPNSENSASTTGYSDGSVVTSEQFGANQQFGTNEQFTSSELSPNQLGSEFSDPSNPLSKQTIYFMFDSSEIQQDFIPVVAAHARYLVNHPAQRIILGGHADERGSREYNIALGEQRAKSVYKIMKIQGVADSQMEVVSYGEEKPSANGFDEASFQLNRRVEISYQG